MSVRFILIKNQTCYLWFKLKVNIYVTKSCNEISKVKTRSKFVLFLGSWFLISLQKPNCLFVSIISDYTYGKLFKFESLIVMKLFDCRYLAENVSFSGWQNNNFYIFKVQYQFIIIMYMSYSGLRHYRVMKRFAPLSSYLTKFSQFLPTFFWTKPFSLYYQESNIN